MNNKYVVVTTVDTFRMRYVVPMNELQPLSSDVPINPEWALDSVTCNEVKEFSQSYIGEQIIDFEVKNEEEILKLFDKDNDYLKGWNKDQKLNYIRCWKSDEKYKT